MAAKTKPETAQTELTITAPQPENSQAEPETKVNPEATEAQPEAETNSVAADSTETAETDADAAQENEPEEESSGAIFQAIGIITGEVNFDEENIASVTVEGKTYPLLYKPHLKVAMFALRLEIEKTGANRQRLIVYPKVTHFPPPNQPHQLAFQLVGFEKEGEPSSVGTELEPFEFKLSGLWQFIPVCRVPVISVFRNFDRERLEKLKEAETAKKVRFMKASHIPVMWKDSLVRPFRFNPKLEKEEQGYPLFFQIKAKFVPEKNGFEFVALLAPPLENPPRFLKASKKDKAAVQQQKKKAKFAGKKSDKPNAKKTEKPSKPQPKPKQKQHSGEEPQ